jgi:hypothetical protein
MMAWDDGLNPDAVARGIAQAAEARALGIAELASMIADLEAKPRLDFDGTRKLADAYYALERLRLADATA